MSLKKKFKKTPAKDKPVKPFVVENIFDENSFEFHLTGGPLHTELLIASAIYKIGDKLGEPVPIKCKWFNIKENGQLIEIENVSGAFYQPCVEDVGSKIYVQATPISSLAEYEGMPVFAEVGPLIMNKEIESRVTSMLSKSECIMTSKMDSMNFALTKNNINYQTILPLECQIKIDQNNLSITVSVDPHDKKNFNEEIYKYPLGLNFPYIKICRMTNNIYEIHFQDGQHIRMMAENNVSRDIIAISLKMLCGQKILEHKFLDNQEGKIDEEVKENIMETPKKEEKIEKNEKNNEKSEKNENYEKIIEKSGILEKNEKVLENVNHSLEKNSKIEKSEESLKNDEKIQEILKFEKISEISDFSKNAEITKSHEKNFDLLKTPETHLKVSETLKTDENTENINLLNKITHLSKELDQFRKEKQEYIQDILQLKKEKDVLSTELFNTKHNYMEALRENEQSKTKLEKLITEKNFLLQDLTIYKTQIKENEEVIGSLEAKVKTLNEKIDEKNDENNRNWLKNDENVKKFENEQYEKEILNLKQEIKIYNEQLIIKLSTIKELSQSNEDLENKVNYLMKKTESLKYETSKNYQNFEKNSSEGEDVEKLQMEIVSLEKENKELRKNLEDEKNKKPEPGTQKFELASLASIISNIVLVKSSNQQLQYMQKLANNLTEVITDRELALENQKNINKELIKKLHEIEEASKIKEH